MPQWWFTEYGVNDKHREAMQGEFFANNTHIQSLVREAIQNSLDADDGTPGAVKVRIYYSGLDNGLSPEKYKPYREGADEHYNAPNNGLKRPLPEGVCNFIVIEDFKTSGLKGSLVKDERGNSYYKFFHAEGQSDKLSGNIGRWGVGKFVFPRASRLRTFFAVTVRDNERLLVGQTILKIHDVADETYPPDGWFGEREKPTRDSKNLPATTHVCINDFSEKFNLKRKMESGLSIVVPYVDGEISNAQIIKAVIRNFFFAILENRLIVSVEVANEPSLCINAMTIGELSKQFQGEGADEIATIIEMATTALRMSDSDFIHLNATTASNFLDWTDDMLPEKLRAVIKEQFDNGIITVIRVPMYIRPKGKDRLSSEIDVIIKKCDTQEARKPFFVRNGILVPDVPCKSIRGYKILVLVRHSDAVAMLGASETPSHREWLPNTDGFNDLYTFHKKHIDFVIGSPSEIIKRVYALENNKDKKLLSKFFSIPADKDEFKRPKDKSDKNKPGDAPGEPPVPPVPADPKRYYLERLSNGFIIKPGAKKFEKQFAIDIKLAYDRIRGKAKYDTNDFKVNRPPIHLEFNKDEIEMKTAKDNHIFCIIKKERFKLAVFGFDTNRDLDIRIYSREND